MLQGSQGGSSEKAPIIERTSFIIKLALINELLTLFGFVDNQFLSDRL